MGVSQSEFEKTKKMANRIPASDQSRIAEVLARHEQALLKDWLMAQATSLAARKDLISESDLSKQSSEFLAIFSPACRAGNLTDLTTPNWKPVLGFLGNVSRSWALQGFSPSETAGRWTRPWP